MHFHTDTMRLAATGLWNDRLQQHATRQICKLQHHKQNPLNVIIGKHFSEIWPSSVASKDTGLPGRRYTRIASKEQACAGHRVGQLRDWDRLPGVPNGPRVSLSRDLFFPAKAGEEERDGAGGQGNVINWLHDKTVLVPIRCPSPDPPWLLLKIWGHATWRQGYAHACPRIRASAAYPRVGGPGCVRRFEEEERQPIWASVSRVFRHPIENFAWYRRTLMTRYIRWEDKRFTWIKHDRRSVKGSQLRFDAIDSYRAVAFRSSREFLRRRENILIYRSLIKW